MLFALPLITVLGVLFNMANGRTDAYYARFTSPRSGSLITGTSRASRIQPTDVLNAFGTPGPADDMYNYSFTISHSPYGPAYYKSIERKLDRKARGGLHIVTVDPWSIVADSEAPDDVDRFKENKLPIGVIHFVNGSPNLEYLIRCYKKPFIDLINDHLKPPGTMIHDNGWLELSSGLSKEAQEKGRMMILSDLREDAERLAPSRPRLAGLMRTIELLRTTGDVMLVRLPVSDQMLAVEDSFMPSFDRAMELLAARTNVPYVNFTDSLDRYMYPDGSHMDKPSATRVSMQLGRIARARRDGPAVH